MVRSRFLNRVAALPSGGIWAVGQAGTGVAFAAAWTGSSWLSSPTQTPGDNSTFRGVATSGDGEVWAVGIDDDNPNETNQTLIERICPGPAPTISGFSPARGAAGASVTLTGTNLSDVDAVSFAGTAASFKVKSDTEVKAAVPLTAIDGPISVSAPDSTATSSSAFEVKPTITSFSPASGPPGTQVIITGSGFADVTKVTFGGKRAAFSDSSTQIVTAVPSKALTGAHLRNHSKRQGHKRSGLHCHVSLHPCQISW